MSEGINKVVILFTAPEGYNYGSAYYGDDYSFEEMEVL